jgi:hypothetical protein
VIWMVRSKPRRAMTRAPLITVEDPLTVNHRRQIADFASKNRLPAIFGLREFVDAGVSWPYGAHLLICFGAQP